MTDRALYCHDYVNQPYPRIRGMLLANPHYVFRHATGAAGTKSAALRVRVSGVVIGTEVAIELVGFEHECPHDSTATKIMLEWRAATSSRIFPPMKATLVVSAVTPTETQLELRGAYSPPMENPAEEIDPDAGYRLAEASVTGFLRQVAGWLGDVLAPPDAMATGKARTVASVEPTVDAEA